MKSIYILCLILALNACEQKDEKKTSSGEPRIHQIELSQEYESVIVTLPGKDNLSLRVFQQDGELVAAVIDTREELGQLSNQVQRWELIAKSNRQVQMYLRREPYELSKLEGRQPEMTGTEEYLDTDGNGILDYKRNSTGIYKVSKIEFEYYDEGKFDDDIEKFAPVKPEEIYYTKDPKTMKPIKMPNKSQYPTPTAPESEVHTQ
jgi:major membrane immunogen (membrane-anchored lipoprotein)